eukprot:953740-Prymnesium_polylepis.2
MRVAHILSGAHRRLQELRVWRRGRDAAREDLGDTCRLGRAKDVAHIGGGPQVIEDNVQWMVWRATCVGDGEGAVVVSQPLLRGGALLAHEEEDGRGDAGGTLRLLSRRQGARRLREDERR